MNRRIVSLLAALFLVALTLVATPTRAFAASDTFDDFSATYTVTPSGEVQVKETWVLRFGPGSGRHGFERYLVTREPYGTTDQDQVFQIDNIAVTSPDPVSTQVSTTTYDSGDDGREKAMRIRIGDANTTVSSDTATYVISYDVKGALRTGAADRPELYWDVTGSDMGTIEKATVTTIVPGGVVATECYVGPPGRNSTTPCTSKDFEGNTATFTQDTIPHGSLLTVATQMNAGAVADAQPILVERADAESRRQGLLTLGAGLAGAAAIPVIGWLWYRRRGHDERYAGVPPGTVPLSGQPSHVVRNDPSIQVPVAFSPPKLPVAYAGFLLDGKYKVEHLTATIVGLATAGAIRLDSRDGETATLVDAQRATTKPDDIVMSDLFDRGTSVDLKRAGQLADASRALAADEERVALSNGWFRRITRGRKSASGFGFVWIIAWLLMGTGWMTFGLLWLLLPMTVSLIITLMVVRSRMARGQRTALGRAWTDQVEGFRTYISTAEADQLKFEEGEDIFSKYLPWAVLFGETDRWVKVCEQAIAAGRIPEPSGYWYGGVGWDPTLMLWNLNNVTNSVNTGAAPAFTSSGPSFSSDTGFGGGSAFGGGGSFGGGGFSGGGGGGGGGGSW